MDKDMMVGLARHVLQIAGGYMIAKGVVDSAGWDLIMGAVTSLATAGWYLWSKRAA